MKLFNLDIEMDYSHHKGSGEIHCWINHLQQIDIELKQIYAKQNLAEHALIRNALHLKIKHNLSILNSLKDYKSFRDYWSVCNSSQIEMAFLQQHNTYKYQYLAHIKTCQSLKSKLTN
ncbi:hypothetical protein [Formosa haliotis]|uniref:hypothetical protein n=1 Tax=Formosa haliotis TaxID=1555194 RepID=UPI0008261F64|nr:hypothetical protein [Formosa haliotis]